MIVALASLTYAIIEAPTAGWTSPQTIGLFALSRAARWRAWSAYEPRRADPLIELRFFRSAPFTGATLIAISAFAGFSGFLFLNTLYLQDVRGYSALRGRAVHAADGARGDGLQPALGARRRRLAGPTAAAASPASACSRARCC